jgi:hypothetical protein
MFLLQNGEALNKDLVNYVQNSLCCIGYNEELLAMLKTRQLIARAISGLQYKHITIINDNSRAVSK